MLVALVCFTGSTGTAVAGGSPKVSSVSVEPTAGLVKAGDTLYITARTLKQGSSFTDRWTGATKVSTVLTGEGDYVSTATFSVTPEGEYAITITSPCPQAKALSPGKGHAPLP